MGYCQMSGLAPSSGYLSWSRARMEDPKEDPWQCLCSDEIPWGKQVRRREFLSVVSYPMFFLKVYITAYRLLLGLLIMLRVLFYVYVC